MPRLSRPLVSLYGGLIAANVAAWTWALILFHRDPLALGAAALAWGLGLRHAVDADHIAAIDNVTRKLMYEGRRPLTVGFWFALGHSSIVFIAATLVAFAAAAASGLAVWRALGGTLATLVSMGFLFSIAATNLVILIGVWRTFRKVRAGGAYQAMDFDRLMAGRGVLARLFRPLFSLVRAPWQMAILGFLFGLGFDTATEVALLGLSASQAQHGLSVGVVIALPALFAAGMTLVDTTDGVMMVGAYAWAAVKPVRKLYYNLTITLASALVAAVIGGIEGASLLADRLGLTGGLWSAARRLGGQFNLIGFGVVGLFAVCWTLSWAIYRWGRFDDLDIRAAE